MINDYFQERSKQACNASIQTSSKWVRGDYNSLHLPEQHTTLLSITSLPISCSQPSSASDSELSDIFNQSFSSYPTVHCWSKLTLPQLFYVSYCACVKTFENFSTPRLNIYRPSPLEGCIFYHLPKLRCTSSLWQWIVRSQSRGTRTVWRGYRGS